MVFDNYNSNCELRFCCYSDKTNGSLAKTILLRILFINMCNTLKKKIKSSMNM